jgi:hypothetical protein
MIDATFFSANDPRGGKLCLCPWRYPGPATFRLRVRREHVLRLLREQVAFAECSWRPFHANFTRALAYVYVHGKEV